MNPLRQKPNEENQPMTEAEIERIMRENGIEPFNVDEGIGEGKDLWTEEEFEEFQIWLREFRKQGTYKSKID